MGKFKSYLLIIALSLIVIIPGCKKDKNYNLTGTWNITVTILGQNYQDTIVLSGSENSGTGSHLIYGEVGTYQIDGSDVTFSGQFQDDSYTIVVSGSGVITDETNMNGTFVFYSTSFPDYKISGTWTAKKD